MDKSIEKILDELKPFTPVIQWGVVAGKWFITLIDFDEKYFACDDLCEGLKAALKRVQS